MNKVETFVLEYNVGVKGRDIGAYHVSYNKRALEIFKTKTECRGHFIRKKYWYDILNSMDGEYR